MSAPPIQADPIGQYTTKLDLYRVLTEWLAYWFDGNMRAIGAGREVDWPRLPDEAIRFDSTVESSTQPLRVRCIVMSNRERQFDAVQADERLVMSDCTVQWFVSCSAQGHDPQQGNAVDQSQKVSGLITALLRAPESRLQLRQHGIVISNVRDPVTIPSGDGEYLQLVSHSLEIRFNIPI
jgi:hypothetical protein